MNHSSKWLVLSALTAAISYHPYLAFADEVEEVLVTGSYIKGSPEDAPSPIEVIDIDDMISIGSPTLTELIKNLGVSNGIDGETNAFQSNGLEGTSNINLRGLGAARTLVLINGTRQVVAPTAIAETGQLFVDINKIPTIAIQRIEILKDGGSATYGSDAIAGVANMITRKDFEGFELSASYTDIDKSDGDYTLGAIFGIANDSTHWVTSVGYRTRDEVGIRERSWGIRDYDSNTGGGWSGIGNPGTIVPLQGDLSEASGAWLFDPDAFADADCASVGSFADPNGLNCRFQFTQFFSTIEEEEHYQIFSELSHQFNDDWGVRAEGLYAYSDVPQWKNSPSFPPQKLVDPAQFIPADHPGLVDYLARHGSELPADVLANVTDNGAIFHGRSVGASGPAAEGYREHTTWRMSLGIDGILTDSMEFHGAITYAEAESEVISPDNLIFKLQQAFRGLGGPNCDAATGSPGVGDCEYYNPFVTAFPTSALVEGGPNALFNPALANSSELLDWLKTDTGSTRTTELFVLDGVFSGEWFDVDGGPVAWAAGFQYRDEYFEVDPVDISNLALNPCPNTPLNGDTNCTPVGPFAFLAGTSAFDADQDIYAVFAELAVPIRENIDIQLALRYEDYGGDTGDTIDPKMAVRWDVSEQITLRGSIGTSFRGPTLNQIQGRGTSLQFVASTLAFKAVDTVGTPDLDPESATTFNFGVILHPIETVTMSLDFWRFDFEDPIIVESFNELVSAAFDPVSPNAQALSQITTSNGAATGIERIEVNYTNGPEVDTRGIDWAFTWDLDTDLGSWVFGGDATYVHKYEVAAGEFGGRFEANGFLNRTRSQRPIPDTKSQAYVNFERDQHNLRFVWYYISGYEDERGFESIDSHNTYDIHYNYRFNEDQTRLSFSVQNLTDEDPPFAHLDMNYDPYTHSPLGRVFKASVSHNFEGLF